MNKIKTILTNTELFCKLSAKQIDNLLKQPSVKIRTFCRGEQIFPDIDKRLCILLEGQAEGFSGHTPLKDFACADIFGAAALFCEDVSPTVIIAKTKGRAVYIDKDALCQLMAENTDFALIYIAFLSRKISFLNKKISAFTSENAYRKAIKYLYEYSAQQPEFNLPGSISKLADSLAIGRASLYRAFDMLEKNGLISREHRHICILDREKLKNNL